jgi:hypothetical protein
MRKVLKVLGRVIVYTGLVATVPVYLAGTAVGAILSVFVAGLRNGQGLILVMVQRAVVDVLAALARCKK